MGPGGVSVTGQTVKLGGRSGRGWAKLCSGGGGGGRARAAATWHVVAASPSTSTSGRNILFFLRTWGAFVRGSIGGSPLLELAAATSRWSLMWWTASFIWVKVSWQPLKGQAMCFTGLSSMHLRVIWPVVREGSAQWKMMVEEGWLTSRWQDNSLKEVVELLFVVSVVDGTLESGFALASCIDVLIVVSVLWLVAFFLHYILSYWWGSGKRYSEKQRKWGEKWSERVIWWEATRERESLYRSLYN